MKAWVHCCSYCGVQIGEFEYEQADYEMCEECAKVSSMVTKSMWSVETKEGINKLRKYFDDRELCCSDFEWFILWHQVPTHSMSPVIKKLRSGEKSIDDILFEFSSLTYGDGVCVETEKCQHEGIFLYGTDEFVAILKGKSTVLIKNLIIDNIKITQMSRGDRISEMIQAEHLNSKSEDNGNRHIG